MKKLSIVILLLVFLAACTNELPPSPPPPGGDVGAGRAFAGMAAGMPAWAVPPKNIAVTPQTAYFGDGVVVSVGNFDYIYSNGYLFNSKTRTWEKFALQGDQIESWLKGQALGSFSVSDAKFAPGDNYAVVYACTKSGSKWECNDKKWMLVTFKVMGAATSAIPELANVDKMVLNLPIGPMKIVSTTAEKDNFGDINVIRYDAKYREDKTGLIVLTHVFDFVNRADLDKTLHSFFKEIINQGWKVHNGQNIALFLSEEDHRIAVWSSGKELLYVETFEAEAGNKEVVEGYLSKYPSDLKKIT